MTTTAAKRARRRARIKSALYRAVRTFVQGFLSTFTLAQLSTPGGAHFDTLEQLAIAGAIGGGAAVLALVQRWLDTVDAVPTIPPG